MVNRTVPNQDGNIVSAHRTRGILRAAALLAAGAAPLLAGTASAAEAPLDTVGGKLGEATQRVDLDLTKPAADLVAGKKLQLPNPLGAPVASAPQLPHAGLNSVVEAPLVGQLPLTPMMPTAPGHEQAAPAARQLPGAPAVAPPEVKKPALPGLPDSPTPPVALPIVG